jgi:hypothetical protein
MTKAGAKTNLKQSAARRHAEERSNDRAVYITIMMVGLFILGIAFLATDDWPWWIVGMLAAVLAMINYFGWKTVFGHKLAAWQRSLAKVPLRFVGFGTRSGKPLDAAKGEDAAKMALYVMAAMSVILLLGVWALIAMLAGK